MYAKYEDEKFKTYGLGLCKLLYALQSDAIALPSNRHSIDTVREWLQYAVPSKLFFHFEDDDNITTNIVVG